MSDAAGNPGGAGGAGAGGAGAPSGAAAGATGGGAGGAAEKPFYDGWGLEQSQTDFIVGKGFKSAADLAKSALLSDKLVRERKVVPAPDMQKIQDWEGWEALGWSKELGQYKLPDAKVPQGLEYNKDMEGALVKAMHEARLPPHQAASVRDALIGMLKAETDARDARGKAELEGLQGSLKQKWGGEYDAKTDLAGRAARALGVDLATTQALEKFMGAPALLEHFANIGEKLGEDVLRGGSARAEQGMSPDAAGAEQRRLSADREFMKSLSDTRHPLHKDNQARWLKVIEAKAGARR